MSSEELQTPPDACIQSQNVHHLCDSPMSKTALLTKLIDINQSADDREG